MNTRNELQRAKQKLITLENKHARLIEQRKVNDMAEVMTAIIHQRFLIEQLKLKQNGAT